jgi:hypothetical protein
MSSAHAAKGDSEDVVAEYRRRLAAFYDRAERWVKSAGFACRREETNLNEEVTGRYKVPRLLIRTARNERVAELEPVGAYVIGAYGRVDLRGAFDQIPLVYLVSGGPSLHTSIQTGRIVAGAAATPLFGGVDRDDWYSLEREGTAHVQRVDKSHFLELLRRVSEHDVR